MVRWPLETSRLYTYYWFKLLRWVSSFTLSNCLLFASSSYTILDFFDSWVVRLSGIVSSLIFCQTECCRCLNSYDSFFTTWERAWTLFILAYFAAVNNPQIWFFLKLSSQNTAFLSYVVHEEWLSTGVPKTQTQKIKQLFSVLTHITSSRHDYPEEEETPTYEGWRCSSYF